VAVDSTAKDIATSEAETIAGLEAAKGYIRRELKERMGVRHVPELSFLADRSGRFQARIEELMSRGRKSSGSGKSAGSDRSSPKAGPADANPSPEKEAPLR
jgi:ribosome-binding factor A